MIRREYGYGTGTQVVEIPEENFLGDLRENVVKPAFSGEEAVRQALLQPVGTPRLRDILHPGEKIAIVTSDITRPMPTAQVMPLLLEEMYAAGVSPKDIVLVFALGSHRKQTEAERRKLAGEQAWREIRCIDSAPEDCVLLGTTSRGTPVEITRSVARADRVICLGNIEYHYFAGYSGGAKAVMPGASNRMAIQANHGMMVDPACRAGALDSNPLRMDIDEAGRIVGIDYILNVVLDEHKQVIFAVAGHPIAAHREGCRFLDGLYRVEIPQKADIVLVSQGGAPKDLNLYQTQKALDNAAHAVKNGGIIILIGSCAEGMGEDVFEKWMTQSPSPKAMIRRISHDFQLGGHKAAAIAMVLEKAEICLVSELAEAFVRSIFLTPKASAQEALDYALKKLDPRATVLSMPCGGSTLPYVKE